MTKYAYRSGYIDGLLGRESENPYGWDKTLSMVAYAKGYLIGSEYRRSHNITIKIERMM